MVNKQMYQEVLARLRNAVRKKKYEFLENQTWKLHHNNSVGLREAPHPPHKIYSPDNNW
jgi:hypothetical protein